MKHRVFKAAVLGAAAWLVATPDLGLAFGKKKGGDCAPACATPCAPAVTYTTVEKDVTVLEPKWVTKDVEVTVNKMVQVEKDVTYTVAVPKTKTEKRDVVSYQTVAVQKPYEYFVNELVPTKEKRTVYECVTESKVVDVDVVKCVWTPKTETVMVAVCKQVPVAPVAPCGMTAGCAPCAPACEPCAPACGHEKHKLFGRRKHDCAAPVAVSCAPAYTTVVEHVPVTRTVNVMSTVTEKVKQTVYEVKTVAKEVEVVVHKCVVTKKAGTHTVYECQPVKSTVDVVVHFCEYETKKDKVKVWECVPVKETVKQSHCEWVSVVKKVQVQVAVPCAAPAPVCAPVECAPVAVVADCGHEKKKLFGGFGKHSCGGCK